MVKPEPGLVLQDPPKYVTEHLRDLRRGVLRSLAACGIGTALIFWKLPAVFRLLLAPLERAAGFHPGQVLPFGGLQTLSPAEVLVIHMRMAFFLGLVVASPVVLREIWAFAAPGLKPQEKRALLPAFLLGLGFFLAGAAFAYAGALPLMLRFFMAYNLEFGVSPQWTLQGYLSFLLTLMLSFGVCFELPLLVWVLSSLGLVTPEFLKEKRKFVVLALFVLAAAVTPTGDPLTLVLLALPLCLLYEGGILLSRWTRRKSTAGKA